MGRRKRKGNRWNEAAVTLIGGGLAFLLLGVVLRRSPLGSGSDLLAAAGLAMLAFGACLGWFALRRRKRERGQGLRSVNRP